MRRRAHVIRTSDQSGKFFTEGNWIFPSGFVSRVEFVSLKNPNEYEVYKNFVTEKGTFRVASMSSNTEFEKATCSEVWDEVLARVEKAAAKISNAIRLPRKVKGFEMFGVHIDSVRDNIEALCLNHKGYLQLVESKPRDLPPPAKKKQRLSVASATSSRSVSIKARHQASAKGPKTISIESRSSFGETERDAPPSDTTSSTDPDEAPTNREAIASESDEEYIRIDEEAYLRAGACKSAPIVDADSGQPNFTSKPCTNTPVVLKFRQTTVVSHPECTPFAHGLPAGFKSIATFDSAEGAGQAHTFSNEVLQTGMCRVIHDQSGRVFCESSPSEVWARIQSGSEGFSHSAMFNYFLGVVDDESFDDFNEKERDEQNATEREDSVSNSEKVKEGIKGCSEPVIKPEPSRSIDTSAHEDYLWNSDGITNETESCSESVSNLEPSHPVGSSDRMSGNVVNHKLECSQSQGKALSLRGDVSFTASVQILSLGAHSNIFFRVGDTLIPNGFRSEIVIKIAVNTEPPGSVSQRYESMCVIHNKHGQPVFTVSGNEKTWYASDPDTVWRHVFIDIARSDSCSPSSVLLGTLARCFKTGSGLRLFGVSNKEVAARIRLHFTSRQDRVRIVDCIPKQTLLDFGSSINKSEMDASEMDVSDVAAKSSTCTGLGDECKNVKMPLTAPKTKQVAVVKEEVKRSNRGAYRRNVKLIQTCAAGNQVFVRMRENIVAAIGLTTETEYDSWRNPLESAIYKSEIVLASNTEGVYYPMFRVSALGRTWESTSLRQVWRCIQSDIDKERAKLTLPVTPKNENLGFCLMGLRQKPIIGAIMETLLSSPDPQILEPESYRTIRAQCNVYDDNIGPMADVSKKNCSPGEDQGRTDFLRLGNEVMGNGSCAVVSGDKQKAFDGSMSDVESEQKAEKQGSVIAGADIRLAVDTPYHICQTSVTRTPTFTSPERCKDNRDDDVVSHLVPWSRPQVLRYWDLSNDFFLMSSSNNLMEEHEYIVVPSGFSSRVQSRQLKVNSVETVYEFTVLASGMYRVIRYSDVVFEERTVTVFESPDISTVWSLACQGQRGCSSEVDSPSLSISEALSRSGLSDPRVKRLLHKRFTTLERIRMPPSDDKPGLEFMNRSFEAYKSSWLDHSAKFSWGEVLKCGSPSKVRGQVIPLGFHSRLRLPNGPNYAHPLELDCMTDETGLCVVYSPEIGILASSTDVKETLVSALKSAALWQLFKGFGYFSSNGCDGRDFELSDFSDTWILGNDESAELCKHPHLSAMVVTKCSFQFSNALVAVRVGDIVTGILKDGENEWVDDFHLLEGESSSNVRGLRFIRRSVFRPFLDYEFVPSHPYSDLIEAIESGDDRLAYDLFGVLQTSQVAGVLGEALQTDADAMRHMDVHDWLHKDARLAMCTNDFDAES